MKSLAKRILCTALVLMLILALCVPALASTTVYATTALNLRSGPGTNYSIVGALAKGEAATKIGSSGKWYKLSYNGSTVYGHRSYLTTTAPAGGSTGSGTTTTTGNLQATANVNLRSGPGTKYSIIGYLAKGDYATKISTTGSWTKLNYNGTEGYCYTKYVKAVSGGSATVPSASTTKVYALQAVNVLSEPSTTSVPITVLPAGQAAAFCGYHGTFTIVEYNGVRGYVPTTSLSARSSNTALSGTVTCTATVPVRSGPSTGYGVIGYLYPGNTASRTGVSGDWTLISFNNITGYVYTPSVNISYTTTSSSPSGYFQAIVKTDVYDGPSSANNVLGYLDVGQSLPYVGTVGSYLTVQYGNRLAYVLLAHTSLYGGASNMTSYNAYMYSRYANVEVFTAPIDSSTYRRGYLAKDEAVYCVATNALWAQIYVNGETLYVPLSDLTTNYNSTYPGYPWAPGYSDGRLIWEQDLNGGTVKLVDSTGKDTSGTVPSYNSPDYWSSTGPAIDISKLTGATIRAYDAYISNGVRRVEIRISGSTGGTYDGTHYVEWKYVR